MSEKILVIGSNGQIGTELTLALAREHGAENVIATDIRQAPKEITDTVEFHLLDAKDRASIEHIVQRQGTTQVYLLAAMLSALAEKHREAAWELNMQALFHILEMAREGKIQKIFWPSSIAVFGPNTPLDNTTQYTVMDPNTVYGISKLTGELWCNYYHEKFGVDVRSVRFPGLISWKAEPGGGTTDYAVDIFYKAIQQGKYECFLSENTSLPMLYMPDAIRAILSIMSAPAEKIKIRTSYNLAGVSFTPAMLSTEIQKHIPDFTISYAPDFRQQIADTWPNSMEELRAKEDWGWKFDYDISGITEDMIENLRKKLQ